MDFVLEKFIALLRFAVVLGLLVFVHELGHFVAAKLVGVFVERFSIGYGWKLFGFKYRDTEYWLSAIPWGGYLKMAGQEDVPRSSAGDSSTASEEDEHRESWSRLRRWFAGTAEQEDEGPTEEVTVSPQSPDTPVIPEDKKFYNKKVSQRMTVIMAGPVMNILLGPVIFAMMFARGIEIPQWREDTRIGSVAENYPAAEAGMVGGERILSMNGKPIRDWQELQLAIWKNPGREMEMVVERDGVRRTVRMTPRVMGESGRAAIGVDPFVYAEVSDVVEGMPAGRQKLKAGDKVLAINGSEISLTQMLKLIGESPGISLRFTLARGDETFDVEMVPERKKVLSNIAIYEGRVAYLSATVQSQLRTGDRIVSVDGKPVGPDEIDTALNAVLSETVTLGVQRDAGLFRKPASFSLSARVEERGFVGFTVGADSTTVLQKYGFLKSIGKGMVETWKTIDLTFDSIALLVSRKVSAREVMGPVGIFAITERTAQMGFSHLLSFIGIITVNLAMVNLLPIPVLDGGHILFSAIEGIRRKPLDERYMEILHQLGFAFIIFLVLLVTYNDIMRFFVE